MRNKPRIRFKGFTEDWEQRKLGDLIFLNGRIGFRGYTEADIISKDEGGVLTFSPTNIVDNQITIKCKNTYITRLKYDESPEIKIYNGDILFVKTGSTLGKSALVKDIFEDATLNPQVVVMRPNNLDSEFLSVMMLTDNIASQVRKSRIGGAVPTLTESNIKAFDTLIPKNDEEAQKIGKIFGSLDHVITLHQHKLEKLKLAKKALLQKLFPKNGSQFPEIRFKGFTDAWEQRKFSEITYLSGIKNKENKPYESYSISNEFGFIPQNEQFENGGTMKTADKSMYYIVTQNSFAYNPARINVGSIGYYDKPDNVIVSSLYEVFKTTEIVNDKFLWHWFKSNQFNRLIEKYQEGGVRLYFYYDKLCKGTIELPTIDEQNKISNLLESLDLYITLHQRKLERLQEVKKGLLQKMFV